MREFTYRERPAGRARPLSRVPPIRGRVAYRPAGPQAGGKTRDLDQLNELRRPLYGVFVVLCDYLRLESLRREIHEGLQVIENWNSANDFILYGKGGEFASNRRRRIRRWDQRR